MDAVWEQWDLVCQDPDGCDAMVQTLRVIIWCYFAIALLVFYVAIRAWTDSLPRIVGMAIAAGGSFLVVSLARSHIAETGSIRALVVISLFGLAAAYIGRPSWARLPDREPTQAGEFEPEPGRTDSGGTGSGGADAASPDAGGAESVTDGLPPTSATP